ncbi:hypothetical protein AAIB41_02480 [Brucella sp. BE17]|uniref:hypothetical protein n=1 Tax=Brucella sp. BE17 TaxID=3142977 RepID=UPI0031BAF5F3
MIPTVETQPYVELTLWHILKIAGSYHLVGEPLNRADGGPRISSPIAEMDARNWLATTSSGREYRLMEGSTVPLGHLRNGFLKGYCAHYGLDIDDVGLADALEVELALASPANRLKV